MKTTMKPGQTSCLKPFNQPDFSTFGIRKTCAVIRGTGFFDPAHLSRKGQDTAPVSTSDQRFDQRFGNQLNNIARVSSRPLPNCLRTA